MKKKIIETTLAPKPLGPYSQAIKSGNMLFVSGQIPIDPQTGTIINDSIELETKQVMENLGAVITEAGLKFNDVVKCSIFLKDMNQFSKINEIYATYFDNNPPCRETVEVSRLPKNVNIEISCIAIY